MLYPTPPGGQADSLEERVEQHPPEICQEGYPVALGQRVHPTMNAMHKGDCRMLTTDCGDTD
eukprot:1998224-Pyramimonas_sp.AAC.1